MFISLIETTLSRDILSMTHVDKPALLRQLFQLGCSYSGQVLSYQKMLGQLQDAGNMSRIVSTLKNGAGVVTSRADVHYVVTDAHPQFRAELEAAAKERKLL